MLCEEVVLPGKDHDELDPNSKRDLWARLLKSTSSSRSTMFSSGGQKGRVLLLGESNSGKTQLARMLHGQFESSHPQPGVGLDYFHQMVPAGSDLKLPFSICTIDGAMQNSNLIDLVLNEKTIQHTIVVLCLDASQPWSFPGVLEDWLLRLRQHIKRLKLPDEDELKGLVFALTKSDEIPRLEKQFESHEETYELVQLYLRQVALDHAASVVFTSAKLGTNCEQLRGLLLMQLFPQHQTKLAPEETINLVDRQSIFLPTGCDSQSKIDTLRATLSQNFRSLPYEVVIKRPLPRSGLDQLLEVQPEEEQAFLARLQLQLSQQHQQTSAAQASGGNSQPSSCGVVADLSPSGKQDEKEAMLNNFFCTLLNNKIVVNAPPPSSS